MKNSKLLGIIVVVVCVLSIIITATGVISSRFSFTKEDETAVSEEVSADGESTDETSTEAESTNEDENGKTIEKAYEVLPMSADLKAGDVCEFGAYEQDNNAENGKEAIQWIVLENNEGKLLLISKYGLDTVAYNEKYEDITWENSSIRSWINNDFFNEAFDEAAQTKIIESTIENPSNEYNSDGLEFTTDGGKDTADKVYLLSIDEAGKYFESDESRKCLPTEYAKSKNTYTSSTQFIVTADNEENGTCIWWLRSPGNSGESAASVHCEGAINALGGTIDYTRNCIRPVIQVNP